MPFALTFNPAYAADDSASDEDGYAAALTNFKYIANGVLTTDEAVSAMGADADEIAVAIDRVKEKK